MSANSTAEAEEKSGTAPKDDDREYTAGTELLQKMERGFARAAYRMAHGFAEGIRVYHDESEKSADEKKDGVARDMFVNAAKGFSAAMSEMGKAPLEVAKATDTEAAWEFTRSVSNSVDKALRRDSKDNDRKKDDDD